MQVCNMQVCKYANMKECKYESKQVCKYVSMQVCKYASMQVVVFNATDDIDVVLQHAIVLCCNRP